MLSKINYEAEDVEIIEKSTLEIGDKEAETVLMAYKLNGEVVQEEIDIFIPINDTQYYSINLVCDKNEKSEHNFGMMIGCAKSFKLNK